MFCLPALLCAEFLQRETKMSIFSDFLIQMSLKYTQLPSHIGKMFRFLEIYRFAVNPLTINQNVISMSFLLLKSYCKNSWGFTQTPPPPGRARVKAEPYFLQQATAPSCFKELKLIEKIANTPGTSIRKHFWYDLQSLHTHYMALEINRTIG